jgi:hypothetical protein
MVSSDGDRGEHSDRPFFRPKFGVGRFGVVSRGLNLASQGGLNYAVP